MSLYEDLGVKTLINASATLTVLGGSRMPPEVARAMAEASQHFVDIHGLQRKVGNRIAELTQNEAAYVCSGAAGGIVLAAAACIVGTDETRSIHFPDLTGLKNEILIHHTQRNEFDYQISQLGIRLVEFGAASGTRREDLIAAITGRTAAVFWFQGAMTGPGDLPLEQVIKIAHEHALPVVVDAAAQLPPPDNLWRFTQMGADLAIFSGGKDLGGPQASGLILGRKHWVEACRALGSPNEGIGRPMKVGKEEMMGLLAAVERYLTLDHQAREAFCEASVKLWCERLAGIAGLSAERAFPNEAGQPLPWCKIEVDSSHLGMTRADMVKALADGQPGVMVNVLPNADGEVFFMNPATLQMGEENIVLERLLAIVS